MSDSLPTLAEYRVSIRKHVRQIEIRARDIKFLYKYAPKTVEKGPEQVQKHEVTNNYMTIQRKKSPVIAVLGTNQDKIL